MSNKGIGFSALIFCLIVSILMLPTDIAIGQEGPFAEIREKLASISDAEQQSLQTLFVSMQQIQEIEKEEKQITRDIETKTGEIEGLTVSVAEEEIAYTNKKEDLKQVLRSYQRMGTGTYLEILLNSDSLAMLLRRVNVLRDLTRNTGKLMELLEEAQGTLLTKQTKLAEMIRSMEDQQQQLRVSLTKKQQLREEQENYLVSLKDERESYQENLADLQQAWDDVKTLIPAIIQELSNIIDEGTIPLDKLRLSYHLKTISGAIDQKTFNDLISGNPSLPKVEFRFYPSHVEISLPGYDLILTGHFVIQEAYTIKFEVDEGRFYGIPLDPGAIEELFLKGDLKFNLKLPLDNYTLSSINTEDGWLELTITP